MDLKVIETGNGGDITKNGSDLAMVFSFENMPYLALFGGNVEAVTQQKRLESEQAFDFWGNSLLFINDTSIQFNSLTEKTLQETPLTSSGRLIIENAIKADLEFMAPFAEVTVVTEIVATDQINIGIGIKKPDNLEEKRFIYIWENGKLLLLDEEYRINPVAMTDEFLQYELNAFL